MHPRRIIRIGRLVPALVLAALTAGWTATASAQGPGIDLAHVGPQVGERAPAFALPDQNGRMRSLASLQGDRGLMLVFYRSADW